MLGEDNIVGINRKPDFSVSTRNGLNKALFWAHDVSKGEFYYKYDNGNWGDNKASFCVINGTDVQYSHSSFTSSLGPWDEDADEDETAVTEILKAYNLFLSGVDDILLGEMTRQEAINLIMKLSLIIGGGFHPDHSLGDYVDGGGEALFEDEIVSKYDPLLDKAHRVLGDDVYLIGMAFMDLNDEFSFVEKNFDLV